MEEIWRKFSNTNNYEVSNLGKVRSVERQVKCRNNKTRIVKGKILKQQFNKRTQYYQICYWKDNKRCILNTHSLVAKTFPEICGEWFEGAEVDHINGNRTDNRAINLRVCTHKENRNNPITLKRNGDAHKKKIIAEDLEGNIINVFNSIKEASTTLLISREQISNVCRGLKNKTHNIKFYYG